MYFNVHVQLPNELKIVNGDVIERNEFVIKVKRKKRK